MVAEEDRSGLPLEGGPRGGNSSRCKVGVTAFELGFEVVAERVLDDELEAELCDRKI